MSRMSELEVFVQVAEHSSLSRAAENLGISAAAVSRQLTALEQRLCARLIDRTTRRISLTSVGAAFYQRCKAILGEVKEAEAAVSAAVLEPSGTLTITASISFSIRHIVPLLPEFTRRYPNIDVHIIGANRYYDIMDSGIDLAIRTREFEPDSNLTVRKLATTRRILAASPHYLDRAGAPASVEALADRPFLIYTHANKPQMLKFTKAGESKTVHITGTLEANDGQIIRAAALQGLGILVQPKYIIYEDIVAGRLIPIVDDWDLPRLTINVAFQNRRYLSTKARVFLDFIYAHFRDQEYEKKWTRQQGMR